MRQAMAGMGLSPDLVLVSSAKRTVQTLEALEPWSETPLIDKLDSLYLASASSLLATLQEIPETVRSAMVVGHNPGLHELALLLIGDEAMTLGNQEMRRLADGYPSGALTEFTIPGAWHTLGKGGGRLVRFVCPRDLSDTGQPAV